jgi:hypothetical protein
MAQCFSLTPLSIRKLLGIKSENYDDYIRVSDGKTNYERKISASIRAYLQDHAAAFWNPFSHLDPSELIS